VTLRGEFQGRRLQQIERRLNELGSAVKGNQAFQADRIADVLELIAELRAELGEVKEAVEGARKAYTQLKSNLEK
jgi:TorA maturation chaperone TorD